MQSSHKRLVSLVFLLFLLNISFNLFAAAKQLSSQDGDTVSWLDEVTVIAKKSPRPIRDMANSVIVIDEQWLHETLVKNISDAMRYEPGISVGNGSNRFGLNSFNIRGIEGNRVAEVDGVPVSDGFKVGSFSDTGRDFVDPEILKRVEVLRGLASTLYGNDALGGVVTFTTKDPLGFFAVREGFPSGAESRPQRRQ